MSPGQFANDTCNLFVATPAPISKFTLSSPADQFFTISPPSRRTIALPDNAKPTYFLLGQIHILDFSDKQHSRVIMKRRHPLRSGTNSRKTMHSNLDALTVRWGATGSGNHAGS